MLQWAQLGSDVCAVYSAANCNSESVWTEVLKNMQALVGPDLIGEIQAGDCYEAHMQCSAVLSGLGLP
jgi:hypothetical protein